MSRSKEESLAIDNLKSKRKREQDIHFLAQRQVHTPFRQAVDADQLDLRNAKVTADGLARVALLDQGGAKLTVVCVDACLALLPIFDASHVKGKVEGGGAVAAESSGVVALIGRVFRSPSVVWDWTWYRIERLIAGTLYLAVGNLRERACSRRGEHDGCQEGKDD